MKRRALKSGRPSMWCRRAATEPYFCVNLGTGTMDEARNWVEYCNVEKGTYWSDLRRRNG